jgi:MinD superfamily P-loop ATPase
LIVIDTPPHADLAASKAAECADLVLIPCRPSAFDLAAMRTTLRLVELLSRPAFVVFTAGPPTAPHIYADARELVLGWRPDMPHHPAGPRRLSSCGRRRADRVRARSWRKGGQRDRTASHVDM